jgi:small conductance mechanosensitive channel
MPLAILAATSQGFFERHDQDLLNAVVAIGLTVLVVVLVNRAMTSQGRRLAAAVAGGELRPEVDTRLRFLRRLLDVLIVLVGASAALSPFAGVSQVASTILTSGAIAAAVIGFAARQTLANAIAGILLAVTQPLRIGDVVTFEGETGTVEDVRLTYTWLRTPADARIIVPNERLAAGVLRNDSIVDDTVSVEASFWLHREADPIEALDVLRAALPGVGVRLAETTAEGARLLLLGDPAHPTDRARQEHELRERGLRAWRDAARGSSAPGVEAG